MAKAGKPKMQEGSNAKESSLAKLQYTVDRTCNFIHDGASSYAVRVRRAAKHGVDRATALKGLGAMEEALADARAAIDRAYSPKAEKEAPTSRVSLLD